ncbi:MAG: polysaccharide biosynthesis protein [Candidatus Fermentithermobacillus carboniphilus]|uniref:Polysaccharide biosynthesis protein n=1 Tax=Candidatus Fermentithermobacillus carboniphilus TaxID=3085328 RepID=A0AAT9LD31_9FIRM|nr:MAG: polysaccharide biosynthesis protein [Candidatus Fermentithermobacillus carboniphilus]
MSTKDTQFLKGAFALSLSTLLVKILGAMYRIPLYSMLGSEGIGLYQMAYPIYVVLLGVSSTGLNVAISKVVAERWALRKWSGARAVFRVSMTLMVILGLLASLTLFGLSGWISQNMAKDPRSRLSIMAISPALFVAAILSAFRGWFQGIEEMGAPAISQVVEQVARLLTVFLLGNLLLSRGIEHAAAGATFGAVVGAAVGVVYIAAVYFAKAKTWNSDDSDVGESYLSIVREISSIAAPLSIASAVFGITEIVDLGLVPRRLQVAGFSVEQATELWGQLSGGAFSILNLGSIFSGVQVAFVPSISAAAALRDREGINRRVKKGLAITSALALPAALGLYVLAVPIPTLLFGEPEIGRILKSLAPAFYFFALQQVTAGILQGIGKIKVPLINLGFAAIVKAVLTYKLVAVPSVGVVGAGIATSFHFGVAALLNLLAIYRELGNPIDVLGLFKTSLAGALMAVLAGFSYTRATLVMPEKMATVVAIAVAAFFYGVLALVLGAVPLEDLKAMPIIGSFVSRVSRKRT